MARTLALVFLATAGLGACTTSGIKPTADNEQAPVTSALVDLPPRGPTVVTVVQSQFANALVQRIALSTETSVPGQNVLRATFYGAGSNETSADNTLEPATIVQKQMPREIAGALPGVPMQISPLYVQNKYGPFGYAAGRGAGGDRCLYAWQEIVPKGTAFAWIHAGDTVSIRLRLCDSRASENQLLAVMYGFSLNARARPDGGSSIGSAPPPRADLGRIGAAIYPTPDGAAAPVPTQPAVAVTAPPSRPVIRRIAPRPAPVRRRPAPDIDVDRGPASGYPLVPPPR